MFHNYYLVEITLPTTLKQDFLLWLNPHREEILKLSYFTHSTVWVEQNSKSEDEIKVEVRYFFQKDQDLQNYLKNEATRMRSQLPAVFKERLKFQRYSVRTEIL